MEANLLKSCISDLTDSIFPCGSVQGEIRLIVCLRICGGWCEDYYENCITTLLTVLLTPSSPRTPHATSHCLVSLLMTAEVLRQNLCAFLSCQWRLCHWGTGRVLRGTRKVGWQTRFRWVAFYWKLKVSYAAFWWWLLCFEALRMEVVCNGKVW